MDPKTLEQLQQENTELTKKVTDLQAELDVVNQVNTELTKTVEALSAEKPKIGVPEATVKPVLPTETFEVDGEQYKFTAPVFMYNKQRIVAKEAINDTALLSELVAKGVGVIAKA